MIEMTLAVTMSRIKTTMRYVRVTDDDPRLYQRGGRGCKNGVVKKSQGKPE